MYQTEAKNVKADTLTYKSNNKSVNEKDDWCKYQHQILLISDRLKIHVLESDSDAAIYDRILFVNQKNEKCTAFCTVITNNQKAYNQITLTDCSVKESILYYKDCLWVSDNINLIVELLREVYDLSTDEHSEAFKTLLLLIKYEKDCEAVYLKLLQLLSL